MVDFVKAIFRPLADWKKFVIGFGLTFLFFRLTDQQIIIDSPFILTILTIIAIVLFFIISGYVVACIQKPKKKQVLPSWKQPKLFVRGFLSNVITLVYSIPFIILTILMLGPIISNLIVTESIEQVNQSFATFSPAAIFISIILLLTFYIWPIAITKYAQNWKFSEAFKFKEVFKKAFKVKYFNTWVFAVVYLLIMTILLNYIFVNLIPYIGNTIANTLLLFGVGITIATVFGDLYQSIK